jgi:serine protease Do
MIRIASVILGIFAALAVVRPGAAQDVPAEDYVVEVPMRAAPQDTRALDGVDGFFRDYCSRLRGPTCDMSGHQMNPAYQEPKSGNWLGIRAMRFTGEFELGINPPRGVLVINVDQGSPAEAVGIRPFDVIVGMAGKDVMPGDTTFNDTNDWLQEIRESAVSNEIEFVLVRDGQEQTGTVILPEDPPAPPPWEGSARLDLGITVAAMTTELRARFGIADRVRGALITDVANDGEAARKHLSSGDVVVEVAKTAVRSGDEVRARIDELKKQGKKSASFLIWDRGRGQRLVAFAIK